MNILNRLCGIILWLIVCMHVCFAQTAPADTSANGIIVQQLAPHVYEHISFMSTKDFGKVDCNGMIVVTDNEAVIFDTPADNKSAEALIDYSNKHHWKIKAVIATHFHDDCVGGVEAFSQHQVPCYATNATIELLKTAGNKNYKLIQGFNDSLILSVGNEKVYARYFGEGHTKDNIVAWFPEDKAVFGGCLIKAVGATKGYLGDANTDDWPATVRKVSQHYPTAAIVIPGHGKWGGAELFDYTVKLFE